jgi:trans-aconitate 2-methyltransferase
MSATVSWDPGQYLRYAGERARPFAELLARVGAERPGFVVDLGCGPGNATAALADRWPDAEILGVDSSAEMIARAQEHAVPGRLSFAVGDLRDWTPPRPVDVLVSNATLQWVPGHLDLLPGLVDAVAPGGWFAFAVPGNFGEPSHRLLADLRASPRWRDRVGAGAVRTASVHEPADYLRVLAGLDCRTDVWETTYLHVLSGPDPVLEWMRGTGLRPVLGVLAGADRERFLAEYRDALRAAYPPQPYGTVLPYRRIFAVAQRAGAAR